MSLLANEDLKAALESKDARERLVIMPLLDDRQVGPGSIDLRLGTQFIEVRRRVEPVIDPFEEGLESLELREEEVTVPLGRRLSLHPGQFILGSTLEFIKMPDHLSGQVLGRSSWGRLGLVVATAVVVQPGFAGSLTLELVNMGNVPILLYPGLRIAQLSVWRMTRETGSPYLDESAKYQANLGPQSSRLAWETDELKKIREIGRKLSGVGDTDSPQPV